MLVTNSFFTAGDGIQLARQLNITLLDRHALEMWAWTGRPTTGPSRADPPLTTQASHGPRATAGVRGRRGTVDKRHVHTFIGERPMRSPKTRIRALTRRTSQIEPRDLLIRLVEGRIRGRLARTVRRAAWGSGPGAIPAPHPRPTQPDVTVPGR